MQPQQNQKLLHIQAAEEPLSRLSLCPAIVEPFVENMPTSASSHDSQTQSDVVWIILLGDTMSLKTTFLHTLEGNAQSEGDDYEPTRIA